MRRLALVLRQELAQCYLLVLLLQSNAIQIVQVIRYRESHQYQYNEDRCGGLLPLAMGLDADATFQVDQSERCGQFVREHGPYEQRHVGGFQLHAGDVLASYR